MGKYDSLRKVPSEDITGVRYVDAYAGCIRRGDRVIIISGFPACPDCGHTLTRDFLNDKWKCFECHTVYEGIELANAIESGIAAATPVSIRDKEVKREWRE